VTPDFARDGVDVCHGRVLDEWIDVNDHMNVAYYVLAFDRGVDDLWASFGITDEYIATHRCSTFAVESHVTWQRELLRDAPYVVTSVLLAWDAKRIHQFMRMYHAEEGFLAATAEWMNLHVDLEQRRVTPWPASVLGAIRAFAGSQGSASNPPEAGRRMRVAAADWQVEGYDA